MKTTFTGLGTSLFGFMSFIREMNAIRTLIHRSYFLASTLANFYSELEILINFFIIGNGFPAALLIFVLYGF